MNVSEQADILKHKPVSTQDALMRAVVFSQMLEGYCRKRIDMLLNHCDAGTYGSEAQEAIELGVADASVNAAVKLLLCINLHFSGLEHCNEGGPRWLIDFFSVALKESDEQLPELGAAEVIARHGVLTRERAVADVAAETCELLGVPASAKLVAEAVAQSLMASAAVRDEMLLFALSQPPEALREYLEVFK